MEELPSAEGKVGTGVLPLKAVTPAFFHKRVRIPTARAKGRRGEEGKRDPATGIF